MIQFNSHVLSQAKEQLSQHGFCRIPNALSTEHADQLQNALMKSVYNIALTQDGRPQELANESLRQMSQTQRNQLFANVQSHASRGIGFIYGRHMINHNSHQALRDFSDYLKTPDVLSTFSDTSKQNIVTASAQGTCYDKGYFLTRHNDVTPSEGRVYAYVLGLTKQWHPDWGGLLQFYQQDGSPTESYAPMYNSLTLFEVEKIHAVTYVTPFANSKRLSITGWFRTK